MKAKWLNIFAALILIGMIVVVTCSGNPADVLEGEKNKDISQNIQQDVLPKTINPSNLNIHAEKFQTEGNINEAWQINERLILIKHTLNRDYNYYLYDLDTEELKWIIPFTEHAQFEKIAYDGKLIFVAKNDFDCGNYTFPRRLIYNLETNELTDEEMFLQRDVVFGTLGWQYILDDIKIKTEKLILGFDIAEGQVLAGGIRWPLTSVNYMDEKIKIRIYNIIGEAITKTYPEHPIISRISCIPLSSDVPADNVQLFMGDFPYGQCIEEEYLNFNVPSILLELELKKKVSFKVDSGEDNDFSYIIEMRLTDD